MSTLEYLVNCMDYICIKYKNMSSLIGVSLFFSCKKDEIFKSIRKKKIGRPIIGKENIDETLTKIKYEFYKYYDSEIRSMNDILFKMNKNINKFNIFVIFYKKYAII